MAKDEQIQEFRDAIKTAARWHKRTCTEQAEFDRAAAGAFPGGPDLKAGDWLLHPDEGRCQVLSAEDSMVQLLIADGRSVEVGRDTSTFAPEAIEEGGERVFSMSAKVRH